MTVDRSAIGRRRILAIGGLLLCAALVYLVYAKRVPFVQGYRIEAVVRSTNELKDGSPVRIAGVEVGRVVERRAGPGTASTIVLEVGDTGRPVHRDASLRIRPRLFLEGGYYVDLRPGSPSAPELEDGERLGITRTALPVQFSQVLSALDGDVRASLQQTLDELARAVGRGGAAAFGRAAVPAGAVLRDGAVVARAARGAGRGDLTSFVRDAGRISTALASRDVALRGLVTDLRTATGALARRDDELAETVREIDATVAVAPAALRAVDGLLPPTRRFAAALRPSLRRAPGVLDAADAGLLEAGRLLRPGELPRTLGLLAPTVRELPALTGPLGTLLELVTPVSDCVRDRVLPVLEGKVDDGALSTGQPVWQELVHSLTSFAGGVQNFDGNGHGGRVLVAGGEQTLQTGALPDIGPLVARTSAGVIGSRPRPLAPGTSTPFRPDAPCREQRPVDLNARTDALRATTRRAGPVARRSLRRSGEGLAGLLRRARAAAREGGRP